MHLPRSSSRRRPLALPLLVVAMLLALLATVVPAQAAPGDDPTEPGDPPGPALKFTVLTVGAAPAYGGQQTLRFATNYTAQETSATVYYTPQPGSPLTDVLARSDREGVIAWPTAPRFKPGSYNVTLVVTKETTGISSRQTFSVRKADVASTAANPDLQVQQHRPVDLSVSVGSSASDAVPAGAYTLLARPVHGGADVVVQEGGYDGPGPHVFALRSFAATHTGTWELHFLTSETPLLSPSSTRVATLSVLAATVPTGLELQPGASSYVQGDRSATLSADLQPEFGAGDLRGTVRLLDFGTPTGVEVAVTGPGRVSVPLASLGVGEHRLSLEYLGSDVYGGTASAARTVTVTARSSGGPVQAVPAGRVDGKVVGKRRKAVVRVAVTGPASAGPVTGRAQVVVDGKVVRTVDLRATKGVVRLKLTKLRKGRHTVTVRYLGSDRLRAASRTWKVKVRR